MSSFQFDEKDDSFDQEPELQEETLEGEEFLEDDEEEEKSGSNRTFLIAVGIIAAVVVVLLILGVVYALVIAPNARASQSQQIAQVNAQNTAIAMQGTATEMYNEAVRAQKATLDAMPTATKAPTNTPVILPTNTNTPAPTQPPAATAANGQTETVVAFQTMAAGTLTAQATMGMTPQPTATGLSNTGIMDEVGFPWVIGLSLLLLVVIIVSRRLRMAGR
jgi:cytoskeletal protein RodZ